MRIDIYSYFSYSYFRKRRVKAANLDVSRYFITVSTRTFLQRKLSNRHLRRDVTWRDVTRRDETRRLVTKHTNRALRQRQRENRYWESEYSICFNLPRRCNKYRGLKGKWSKMLFLLPNEIVLIMTRLAQRIFCRRGGGGRDFSPYLTFSRNS